MTPRSIVGDPISKKYPELAWSVNLEGSINVFRKLQAHAVHKFVFLSTCSNYGLRTSDDAATEDADLNPKSVYAETKVEFERFLLDNMEGLDFSPTILRISTAYGLSSRMRFDLTVSEFTRDVVMGKELVVYDKDTWRPYCHLRDMSDAVTRVIEAPADKVRGEVFNVGHTHENFTKHMIIEEVLKHVPEAADRVSFQEGGVDPRNYKVDFSKIRDVLGFVPNHSVRRYVPELVGAMRSGLFSRVDELRNYYGNYEIVTE